MLLYSIDQVMSRDINGYMFTAPEDDFIVSTAVDYRPILDYKPPTTTASTGIERVAITVSGRGVHTVVLDESHIDIHHGDTDEVSCKVHWTPRTHLRSVETLTEGPPIDRNQAVGVVVIPHWKAYLKLMYDRPSGLKRVNYANYRYDYELERVICHDLTAGWDVLMIKADGSSESYCEPKDWRDEQ